MTGQTISHYKILDKLGEGGMGVVYRAEDTRLKRSVALKFLSRSAEKSAEELARFQQEAEAVSALNHPGIAVIYDIGEADGERFLALEFIPGGTVKERLRSLATEGKQFTVAEAVDIVLQMAEALSHAHRQHIVHRDIKSDNVMLTAAGRVKITDFGLAKLRGLSQLTAAGSTVGTLAYMAPEQMKGEEVDARADIYSLGVVFFEILTGRFPFQGAHDAAVMYSVLNEDPLPVSKFRSDVPASVMRIIERFLKKDPIDRYPTMAEAIRELRECLTATPGPVERGEGSKAARAPVPAVDDGAKSIVVLPFENLSPEKENEYFSDGLTEEVITDLSKVRSMRVISRTSAMLLKGTTRDTRSIARDLGVRYVLSGSVRKAGQSVRVSAQLVDGDTDANLWSEKYTGTLDDIFEMQEKVSRAIVDALEVRLTPDESRKLGERPIGDARAHDLFLRGRGELQRGDPDGLKRSIALFQEGLDIVGENELLFAALGYANFAWFRWMSKIDESYLLRAREFAGRALAINPASSHGTTLHGLLRMADGQMVESIGLLKRAVELDPANTEALMYLGIQHAHVGRFEGGLRFIDRLLSIDPLIPMNIMIKGFVYLYHGDFTEGLSWIRKGFQIDPDGPFHRWCLGVSLAWCGLHEEAITHFDHLGRTAPGWVYTQHALFLSHGLKGERDAALKYATPALDLEARHDTHFALHLSHCFAVIGEKARALDFLELSARTGMINHPFLARIDPLLANLRGDPRFAALMEEVRGLYESAEL